MKAMTEPVGLLDESTVRDARQLPARERDLLRLSAVRALEAGKSQKEVAGSLGVSRQALHNWIKIKREKGPEALKTGSRGRPRSRPLQPLQEARVVSTIVLMPPAMVGLPFSCWTRKAIAELIERWFGLRLSSYLVGSYLKCWGFDLQRSVRYRFARTPAPLQERLAAEFAAEAPSLSREQGEQRL